MLEIKTVPTWTGLVTIGIILSCMIVGVSPADKHWALGVSQRQESLWQERFGGFEGRMFVFKEAVRIEVRQCLEEPLGKWYFQACWKIPPVQWGIQNQETCYINSCIQILTLASKKDQWTLRNLGSWGNESIWVFVSPSLLPVSQK